MLKLTKPKLGSAVEQIDIVDISDGVLRLSDNRYRLVLSASSLNFELKSEEEQDTLIDIYESFLNSVGFNFQILIRIREIDFDDYLDELKSKASSEQLTIYKKQLLSYRTFVRSLVKDNKILSRQFFVVVPYDAVSKAEQKLILAQLSLRADIIAKGLARLGVICRKLSSIEIVDLFYSFYSPVQAKTQPISEQTLNLINQQFVVRRSDD